MSSKVQLGDGRTVCQGTSRTASPRRTQIRLEKRDLKIPWRSAHHTSERIEIKWRLFLVRGDSPRQRMSERQGREEEAVIAFFR